MTGFSAPIEEMRFLLHDVVGLERIAALPGYEAATPDLVDAVLAEAARFAEEVLAPLNRVGDQESSVLCNGTVRTPTGFQQAYRQYTEGGWNGLPFDPAIGGQGLPWMVAFAVQEIWQAANMSFALCPLLTQGAVELISRHGTPYLQETFLSPLVSGTWTGTMDLTEPQAGSDLSAVRCKAVRDGDHYRITGQKIFITYGDHDLADNIIHMVLARLPDAPEGSRGISLFLVPKVLVNPDGTPGALNDMRCAGLEHKLGIKASPTAVMSYGDRDGAIAYLVGEENRGLELMFIMMNNARLGVGLQGLGIAERAYQQARAYARTRVQSRELGRTQSERVPILRHPDVRRMLLTMKSGIEAARALAYAAGAALDQAKHDPDPAQARLAEERVDLLTPVVKAWSTDLGCEVASLGIQVHGGVGFIEETGAAQHYRDARIAPIYEGTNGIQANDLVFRKLGRDQGAAAQTLFAEIRADAAALAGRRGDDAAEIAAALVRGLDALTAATAWLIPQIKQDPRAAAAGASPYLRLFGIVAGGALLARAAGIALDRLGAGTGNPSFLEAKIITARFYAGHWLPQADACLAQIRSDHRALLGMAEDQF